MSRSARSPPHPKVSLVLIAVGVAAWLMGLGAVVGVPANDAVASTAHAGQRLPGAAAAPARCGTTQLRAEQVATEGAAGSVYVSVRFTNVSRTACWLAGYPGVLFFAED